MWGGVDLSMCRLLVNLSTAHPYQTKNDPGVLSQGMAAEVIEPALILAYKGLLTLLHPQSNRDSDDYRYH